jgi:hypothetical protein
MTITMTKTACREKENRAEAGKSSTKAEGASNEGAAKQLMLVCPRCLDF